MQTSLYWEQAKYSLIVRFLVACMALLMGRECSAMLDRCDSRCTQTDKIYDTIIQICEWTALKTNVQ